MALPDPWESRLARTRAEAGRFAPFLGEWVGGGEAHGTATGGTLCGAAILDGSIVEVNERTGEHEDRSFYRFDPDNGGFSVLHMMAGAHLREYPVEFTATGLVWVTPPSEPAVEWTFSATELVCEVTWPGDEQPEVRVRWRRSR